VGSILIRNIPDALHDQLRAVAKQNGTSVEALARQALERVVPAAQSPETLLQRARRLQAKYNTAAWGVTWTDTDDDPRFGWAVLGLAEDAPPAAAPRVPDDTP
jgi:plasmid stability protein